MVRCFLEGRHGNILGGTIETLGYLLDGGKPGRARERVQSFPHSKFLRTPREFGFTWRRGRLGMVAPKGVHRGGHGRRIGFDGTHILLLATCTAAHNGFKTHIFGEGVDN
jgi:hypothetical protein